MNSKELLVRNLDKQIQELTKLRTLVEPIILKKQLCEITLFRRADEDVIVGYFDVCHVDKFEFRYLVASRRLYSMGHLSDNNVPSHVVAYWKHLISLKNINEVDLPLYISLPYKTPEYEQILKGKQ